MSTSLRRLRQGLPRTPGGEPWPPPGFVTIEDRPDYLAESVWVDSRAPIAQSSTPGTVNAAGPVERSNPAPQLASDETAPGPTRNRRHVPLRRGLPRAVGGEAWPAAGFGVLVVADEELDLRTAEDDPLKARAATGLTTSTRDATVVDDAEEASEPTILIHVPLRRGLPRTPEGDPWPAAGFGVLPVRVVVDEPTHPSTTDPATAGDPAVVTTPVVADTPDPSYPAVIAGGSIEGSPPAVHDAEISPHRRPVLAESSTPHTAQGAAPQAAWPAETVPSQAAAAASDAQRSADPSGLRAKVVRFARLPALALVAATAVIGGLSMLVGWLMSTDLMITFQARYPGAYAPPEGAEPGFPAWMRWSHFLNMFFIVLIIRAGLQVRHEKKPPAYWTPRWPKNGSKISLSLWMHLMLDILWLLNGVVFVTLLFVTGHWVRIVPTSWEVFPNAFSALLQYLSLDWPTDDGWVSYNSLQQLAYFTVVFVAAPLAAITGVRMSGLWPTKARRLSTLYPVEVARAVHFPTMLFFVVFVITHVAMVTATGVLKNLNHMFHGTDSTNWTGFWIFVGALAAVAVAWELSRPMIVAPIANLIGRVSQR